MKEFEDDTNRWKDIEYSWTGRLNIDKMSILPKAIYRVSAVSISSIKTVRVCLFTQSSLTLRPFGL